MPETTFKKIQALIDEEIAERLQAASDWDEAAACYDADNQHLADTYRVRASASQNRAECLRLKRKKFEMDRESTEPVLL